MGLSALFASIEANAPRGGSTGADISAPKMLTIISIDFKAHKTGSGETMILRTTEGDIVQNVWVLKDGSCTVSNNVLGALKWSHTENKDVAICQRKNNDGFTSLYVGTTLENCQAIMDFAESRRGSQATKASAKPTPKGRKAPETPGELPF
jgi:hypothetical protein